MTVTRREFWRTTGAAAGVLLSRPSLGWAAVNDDVAPTTSALRVDPLDPWASVPRLLERIVAPAFPIRDFVITKYGARINADASDAIEQAINECHQAGGGRVVVPEGNYPTGPIRLKSGVELHVDAGATLLFSQDPARYPTVLTRWEGVELMNYSPLIYALDCFNVGVTGEGTLDGQADEDHWWSWKGRTPPGQPIDRSEPETPAPQVADRDRLNQESENGVPVARRIYGPGTHLRPTFIEPYRSRNVLIEGVTIRNAPFWVMHPTLCTNVTVRNVKVFSHGPNNDGCDPESSRDVLIEDCVFDTGDDCIALKSGRNADGRRIDVPLENVLIRRCHMNAGHGGITIGSEVTGGVRNIFAESCRFDSPELERGLRIKTNTLRGGIVENVFVRDIAIGSVKFAPIEIDLRYESRETGNFMPEIRNVIVDGVSSARSRYGIYIRGLERAPLRNVLIRDSVFRGVAEGHVIEGRVDLTLTHVTVEAAPKEKKT